MSVKPKTGQRVFYLRRQIATMRYVLHEGQRVFAEPDSVTDYKNEWTVWPPGQDFAYVVGIPRRYLRNHRYKRRRT